MYNGSVIDSDTGVVLEELPENEDILGQEATSIMLARAIAAQRRVRIRYYTYSRDEENERDIDPWLVMVYRGKEYLVGYCYLRQEERTFRLDRILSLQILPESINHPRPASWDEQSWENKMGGLSLAYRSGQRSHSDFLLTTPSRLPEQARKESAASRNAGCLSSTMLLVMLTWLVLRALF